MLKISRILIGLILLCMARSAYAQGGSTYAWYYLDTANCSSWPYGVIANYDIAHQTIHNQLVWMRQNGQTRLKIPIFHQNGVNDGTIMDSAGGNLSPKNKANLVNLLADIKNTGYAEIEVVFIPVGQNNPLTWPSFDRNSPEYQENWGLIFNLHSVIANSGLQYWIELLNEGTPYTTQTLLLQYTQQLWQDYVSAFGRHDTVGFSIIASDPSGSSTGRLQMVSQVYQGTLPFVLDLHFYEPPRAALSAYNDFLNAENVLAAEGVKLGWVVGEALYNDPNEANDLRAAINDTGQTVFYVIQWPNAANGGNCNNPEVNVGPNLDFSNYRRQGF